MEITKQKTVSREYEFSGKGLHTGKVAKMVVKPAPVDFVLRFRRTDIGEDAWVEALAENVSNTARSTTISKGEVSVVTVEHLISALTGLGIDNAQIDIDNIEVPILDGSAKPYTDAIGADAPVTQDAPRRYIELKESIEIVDENGGFIRIEPADRPSFDVTIDFNSKVLGVQQAHWDESIDYAKEIGLCRTFVFFHEIEALFAHNLVKGGDVDNAIIIVEHPVTDAQLDNIGSLFDIHGVKVSESGYLTNLVLRFDNECARHKLMDIMGDLRLVGGFLRAKVTGFKTGHHLNTKAAKAVREIINPKSYYAKDTSTCHSSSQCQAR